ncbi:MAG TPA: recombinase family protein [Dehalococcoidia bacterium]|nr:recombinase family protein [Dehalococcoidia bacterium]
MTLIAPGRRAKGSNADPRAVALVTRVSTQRQADNEEGSLKTQLQRLRGHIDYKNGCGENWTEAGVYVLKAVSGKDSMRSEEYAEIFAAVRAGRVNTILCTALERLCRSVKDFLWFFEFINEHGVEFVCLKQQYDTTTPQGKLFVTIMIALAEFEREQTADRTRDATQARAERGLWNGGQLLGYDLDPNHKGYLVPNEDEAALVNAAFDSYLERGSLKETRDALNNRGYRTKSYESRRGKVHAGTQFNFTSIQYLLKNPAYIGKKEVNKKGKSGKAYQLVDAVWPAIVEPSKFEQAQNLLANNARTRHNGAKPIRHTYVLSSNLLFCGRCQGPMEGRSGTGRLGVTYFYYVCRDKACGLRVAADEIEGAVLGRLAQLAADEELVAELTSATNARLKQHAPSLSKRRRALQRSLGETKKDADRVLADWTALEGQGGRAFLTERLNQLAQRRSDLELGLNQIDESLSSLQQQSVSAATVRSALVQFEQVYGCLKPYEQKELIHLVLRKAEVGDKQIVLEINGNVPAVVAGTHDKSVSRSGTPVWLPGQDSDQQYYTNRQTGEHFFVPALRLAS